MGIINALVNHEVQLVQLNTSVEEVTPLLEAISSKEGFYKSRILVSFLFCSGGRQGRMSIYFLLFITRAFEGWRGRINIHWTNSFIARRFLILLGGICLCFLTGGHALIAMGIHILARLGRRGIMC
jgi:hypothetical protein